MKKKLLLTVAIGALTVSALAAVAKDEAADGPILFTNVNVFDGLNENLLEDVNVVVTGNTITRISSEDIAVAGARVIDGEGHTLMSGIIDSQ